jgi:hypothetical protein
MPKEAHGSARKQNEANASAIVKRTEGAGALCCCPFLSCYVRIILETASAV